MSKYIIAGLVCLSVVLLIIFYNLLRPDYLTFSDSAKFADVARQLKHGDGYTTDFSFFANVQPSITNNFSARWILPAMPITILVSSLFLGMTDAAVIANSSFFYIMLVIATYFLGKKIFNTLTGVLAAIAVAVNLQFLDYATSGASEPLFVFLIVVAFYFVSLENKKGNIAAAITGLALYLTRPQAIIYLVGLAIYYLFLNYKNVKDTVKAVIFIFVAVVVVEILLLSLQSLLPIESISYRLFVTLSQHSSALGTDGLRSEIIDSSSIDILSIAKSTFYNIYNFYRTFGDIVSPYPTAFFVLSVVYFKNREQRTFTLTSIYIVIATVLAASMTLPLRRYLHPMVPFIFIPGIAVLTDIVMRKIQPMVVARMVLFFLIGIFVVGQSLGYILLDSRTFNRNRNLTEPPVYVRLSTQLKDVTDSNDLIVTNLDTWGTWYGERKTIWFPLTPEMLNTVIDSVDAVYLTDYLINDENYRMGEEWKDIFNNPTSHSNEFFEDNFEFVDEYTVPASETYENQEGRAVLWVKKN